MSRNKEKMTGTTRRSRKMIRGGRVTRPHPWPPPPPTPELRPRSKSKHSADFSQEEAPKPKQVEEVPRANEQS